MFKGSRILLLGSLACCLALVSPAMATGDCTVSGDIMATPSDNLDLGAWKYCLTTSWSVPCPGDDKDDDDGGGLRVVWIVVDNGGNCACEDMIDWLHFDEVAGQSTGSPDNCTVNYSGLIECGQCYSGARMKFVPTSYDCQPGEEGEGTFCFYSDFAPAEIAEGQEFCLDACSDDDDKAKDDDGGTTSCCGPLTGVFPALPCDPVPTEDNTWDELKSKYFR